MKKQPKRGTLRSTRRGETVKQRKVRLLKAKKSKLTKKIRRRKPTAAEKTYWSLPRTKKSKTKKPVAKKVAKAPVARKARKAQGLVHPFGCSEVAPPKAGSFDTYLLKQTKKNHKYLVQTLKTRWRLSKSKNPKLKAKLARLVGRPVNPGEAGTSAQAFKSIDDRRARMRTEVMKEIMLQGTHGSTTYEIEQALDMLHQTASARVYELTGQGRIIDSGLRRKTGSGRNAIVHVQSQLLT